MEFHFDARVERMVVCSYNNVGENASMIAIEITGMFIFRSGGAP